MSLESTGERMTLTYAPWIILKRIRRSFLLMAAMSGLLMMIFAGGLVAPMGYNVLAGILGASGLAMFIFNMIWYVTYKTGEWYFE